MSTWPRHLILIGPMGSGKSTIGRATASLLHLPFVDTDQMVESAAGMSIARLFAAEGEEAFRRAETRAVQRLLVLPDSVVSTGGGIVLREENWEYMLATGLVIRLLVSPEEAARRTAGDHGRPLLSDRDPVECLRRLMQEREPQYARAPHAIDAESLDLQAAAQEAARLYREWLAPSS